MLFYDWVVPREWSMSILQRSINSIPQSIQFQRIRKHDLHWSTDWSGLLLRYWFCDFHCYRCSIRLDTSPSFLCLLPRLRESRLWYLHRILWWSLWTRICILSWTTKIAAGTLSGETIDLVALGINNGWYDPIISYKAYVDYSYNNTYKSLITAAQHTSYLNTYTKSCLPLLEECTSTTGTNSACVNADDVCYDDIEGPLSNGNFDVYDIREPSNDPYPPETYVTYLQSAAVVKAIGAKSTYSECPNAPYQKFAATGDGKLPNNP